MRYCGILVVFFLVIQGAFAEEGGKILFPETIFQFGSVQQGAVIDHDFIVRNTGSAALTINRVVASCGCTASAASKPVLQANEEGAVKVRFDTSNFSGEVTKTLVVYSTDPGSPMVTLTVQGKIEPGIVVNPPRLIFGDVIRGTPASMEFTAEVVGSSQSRILSAKSFSRFINIEEKISGERKKQFAATLSPDLPLEEFRARITLAVQGPDGKQREIDVPVFASVKGLLKVTPPALSLGILEGKTPIERSVKLEYLGAGAATIKNVESSDPAVGATAKTIQKGRSFVLQVQADPSRVTKDLKAAITVTAVDSEGKETAVSLNVYGTLPPR